MRTNTKIGFNCLKSGTPCVYVLPEIKIFKPDAEILQSKSCFGVFNARKRQPSINLDSPRRTGTIESRDNANDFRSLQQLRPTEIPFEAASERAAFGFWITWTGPMLNTYDMKCGFWITVVPQFSWQSKAVRELLLAAVSVDEKWLSTMKRTQSGSNNQAVRHYSNALTEIRRGHTSKLETLVAALIAWTVEAMLHNYRAGQVHLNGARALIEELELETLKSSDRSTYEFVHLSMRPFLATVEDYNGLMVDSRPNLEEDAWLFESGHEIFKALRDQMSQCITQWRHTKPTIAQLRQYLQSWENANRAQRYSGREPLVLKEAAHHLFTIASKLAQSDDSVDESGTFVHVLQRTADALTPRTHHLSAEESELLEETLGIVLTHLFDVFPSRAEWPGQRKLIEKIARANRRVFERTCILEELGVCCGRPPGHLR